MKHRIAVANTTPRGHMVMPTFRATCPCGWTRQAPTRSEAKSFGRGHFAEVRARIAYRRVKRSLTRSPR